MSCQRVTLAVVIMVLGGCRHADRQTPSGGIEQFGLEEAAADHPVVSAAIATASELLPSTAKVAFSPGWGRSVGHAVPVFAATGTGFGQGEIMTTYAECRCVIVQRGALPRWLASHQGSGEALLLLDERNLLAYMLLHEAGHVVRGEAFHVPATAGAVDAQSAEGQKTLETAADQFAADAITSALREKGSARGVTAARMAATLGELSWNLSEHRLLDDFGGTALRKPALFGDSGLSHPNLEWRVLKVNALITDTPAARQLLDQFENARASGPVYRLFTR